MIKNRKKYNRNNEILQIYFWDSNNNWIHFCFIFFSIQLQFLASHWKIIDFTAEIAASKQYLIIIDARSENSFWSIAIISILNNKKERKTEERMMLNKTQIVKHNNYTIRKTKRLKLFKKKREYICIKKVFRNQHLKCIDNS